MVLSRLNRGGKTLWSYPQEEAGDNVVMESDGSLVMYNGHRRALDTGPTHRGAKLICTNSGSCSIYFKGRPIWKNGEEVGPSCMSNR